MWLLHRVFLAGYLIGLVISGAGNSPGWRDGPSGAELARRFFENIVSNRNFDKSEGPNFEDVSGPFLEGAPLLRDDPSADPSERGARMTAFASFLAHLVDTHTAPQLDTNQKTDVVTQALTDAYLESGVEPNAEFLSELELLIHTYMDTRDTLRDYGRLDQQQLNRLPEHPLEAQSINADQLFPGQRLSGPQLPSSQLQQPPFDSNQLLRSPGFRDISEGWYHPYLNALSTTAAEDSEVFHRLAAPEQHKAGDQDDLPKDYQTHHHLVTPEEQRIKDQDEPPEDYQIYHHLVAQGQQSAGDQDDLAVDYQTLHHLVAPEEKRIKDQDEPPEDYQIYHHLIAVDQQRAKDQNSLTEDHEALHHLEAPEQQSQNDQVKTPEDNHDLVVPEQQRPEDQDETPEDYQTLLQLLDVNEEFKHPMDQGDVPKVNQIFHNPMGPETDEEILNTQVENPEDNQAPDHFAGPDAQEQASIGFTEASEDIKTPDNPVVPDEAELRARDKPHFRNTSVLALPNFEAVFKTTINQGYDRIPQLIKTLRNTRSMGGNTLNLKEFVKGMSASFGIMRYENPYLKHSELFIELLVETLIAAMEIIRKTPYECLGSPTSLGGVSKYINAVYDILT